MTRSDVVVPQSPAGSPSAVCLYVHIGEYTIPVKQQLQQLSQQRQQLWQHIVSLYRHLQGFVIVVFLLYIILCFFFLRITSVLSFTVLRSLCFSSYPNFYPPASTMF